MEEATFVFGWIIRLILYDGERCSLSTLLQSTLSEVMNLTEKTKLI